jgi:gamma-glutamylaminecyclotransferase
MDQVVLRLFVYGSLRRGERNHAFLQGARYLGRTTTQPRYTLRHSGMTPGLAANGEQAVAGELYELDAVHLARLDRLGGALYVRGAVDLADGSSAEAYFMPESHVRCYPEVASGDWARRYRRAGTAR